MKHSFFIAFFLISYFSFSQSESRSISAISTNHFGSVLNVKEKDSVVLIYDQLGNIVEEKYFEVDGFLGVNYRKINNYSKSKLTQSVELKLNKELNIWDTVFKKNLFYASNDSLRKVISSKKSNNVWKYIHLKEFQFDQKNRISEQIEYDWNGLTNTFIAKHKEIFRYNKMNQVVQINRQVCNPVKGWLNTAKDSIVYANGKKMQCFSFYFDDSQKGEWIKTTKETISYDNQNRHSQTLVQYWSTEKNQYINNEYTQLITSEYNSPNRLSTVYVKIFNPTINKYEDFEQKFFY